MTIPRRRLLALGTAIGLAPLGRVFAQSTPEPIRIGFLTVKTGPLAAGGKQQEEGAALFIKERGGMLAGRKVELTTQDTTGNPATAKTKTRELVELHKVPVIIGPLATNEALAMDDYIREAKAPLITTTSAATVDKAHATNPWVLHAFGTAPQVTYPLGDYAAETLGLKRIAIVAEDFTYGHEGAGGFQLAFEAAGGKIVQKLWPPLNAPEYSPFLAQIKPDVDAIYMGFAGINPLRFLKQFAEYGLHGKLAVLGNTTSTDEGVLKNMGDEAVGVYSAGWYAAGLDSPDNKKFVAAINHEYQHDPGFYTAGPYTALLIIEEALTRTGGNAAGESFLKALHEVRLAHGPIGPVRLDDYGTPILDIHIRRVERRDGKLRNGILKTYPQVSQFWIYDPQKFIEQPVFSRDFPPSKYLE